MAEWVVGLAVEVLLPWVFYYCCGDVCPSWVSFHVKLFFSWMLVLSMVNVCDVLVYVRA